MLFFINTRNRNRRKNQEKIGRAEWMTTLRYSWLRMNGEIEDNGELITYGITVVVN